MKGQDQFDRFIAKNPHHHRVFFNRPDATRRRFFQIASAGMLGAFLPGRAKAEEIQEQPVKTINKARNVVFVLLTGAPSHTDTFDLKMVDGITPTDFQPETLNGLLWPNGLMPRIGAALPDVAVIRSMRSWALVHSLAQTWTQIGRNPAAALGSIAPNIGSIVALEKESERRATDVLPTFLALNAQQAVGSGYLSSKYAPFKVVPNASGLRNTTNVDGQSRLEDRWNLLHMLDDDLRVDSPYGQKPEDVDAFYRAAKGLTYNPAVNRAFQMSADDTARYGGSLFGNACLTAKQVLQSDLGTRFVVITFGSWDHHQNIYAPLGQAGLRTMTKQLDDGLGALLADLKANGQLDETLVVATGEFGRTVGALSAAQGRDHYLQQSSLLAGAGIKGGRAIGATDSMGARTREPGWVADRDVRPEDIEATIYSALGINWTRVRYNDPFGRGFEYVPFASDGLYQPVTDLWS